MSAEQWPEWLTDDSPVDFAVATLARELFRHLQTSKRENAELKAKIAELQQWNNNQYATITQYHSDFDAFRRERDQARGALRAASRAHGDATFPINRLRCAQCGSKNFNCDDPTPMAVPPSEDAPATPQLTRRPADWPTMETAEVNLADYAKRYFDLFKQYRGAWLREMGGVIRPKHWEIDGFVLRARDIYEKAQLVDRMKAIMVKKVKARPKRSAEEMFDAVFKMLAEDKHDQIPTN